MSIRKVMLLGADGKLGPSVLQALLAAGFEVTVLKRESSSSPDEYGAASVRKVADSMPVDALVAALQGQDALVATIKGNLIDVQKRLADAAVEAGVKRFVPADFGSCDSSSPLTQELVPLYKGKTELREYLMRLAESNPSFSWTSLVCGHFFDWSLDFMHIWFKERRADILDDGEKKASVSTLSRIAEATARILQHPEQTQNQMLYVQSFCVSQNQIVRAFEEATKSQWKMTRHDSDTFKKEKKKLADSGDKEAIEELVWYLGAIDANWTARKGFAMETLGLKDEDLNEVVNRIVQTA